MPLKPLPHRLKMILENNMFRIRVLSMLAVLLLMFVLSACSGDTAPTEESAANEASAEVSDESTSDETSGETADESSDESSDETSDETSEDVLEQFDPANFDDSTNIDNGWLPMTPGTQWVFEGTTNEDGELIPHRLVFTVTDLTKEIEGVSTLVAWIEDYADEELIEAEIAFYAQDKDGNVWYLGEYPEEYEDGELVDAPAWIAGQEEALAGIKMPAEPRLGTPSFAQGWAPAVEWTDRGQVYRVNQQTCVPADCYDGVLVMDEFNEEEPGAIQLKYYARGVGQVQVGYRGEDAQQEELGLVERVQLDADELAEARETALELEQRAYEMSPDVFGPTSPSEQLPDNSFRPEAVENLMEDFDPDNFGDDSNNIDNQWMPYQPGTQWVFEGNTIENREIVPHLLTFTVTDLTKEVNGVKTAVTYIEDLSAGQLVEAEIAFYAQDKDGVVWYLGEYPEEYLNGEFVDAPTWLAGLEGARAGIKMPVDPQPDTPSYAQGWAPEVDWSDRGQVYRMGQHTCVPYDCYEDVLIMDEYSLTEPGAIQLKYYAPGVGQVRVGFRGDELKPEILELIELNQLDPEALAAIRETALALEARAYEISPDVYGQTSPSEGP